MFESHKKDSAQRRMGIVQSNFLIGMDNLNNILKISFDLILEY
jgi:hypothetical protein